MAITGLTLREEKGSRLTIAEMDGNLTYLQTLATAELYQGTLDCTGTVNYPAATVDQWWAVSVAGTIGTKVVEVGEKIICIEDYAGGSDDSKFIILQVNFDPSDYYTSGETNANFLSGDTSIVWEEGSGTNAIQQVGGGNVASGDYAVAEGYQTIASGDYSHAEGNNTEVFASGQGSHAEGLSTVASEGSSHAEGVETEASGEGSHAEGIETVASGEGSHAEGGDNTASGDYSHAEGYNTIASDYSSHAEGFETVASGDGSHAEGVETVASGAGSHAEGGETEASGEGSHAEGRDNTASGDYSHAEGSNTIASGYSSHAEGYNTEASGNYSHAEGVETVAYLPAMHAKSSGSFNTVQKMQYGSVTAILKTEDATPAELLIDGTVKMVLPSDTYMTGRAMVIAVDETNNLTTHWTCTFGIQNVGGTTTIVSQVVTALKDDITIGGLAITADDGDNTLVFTGTGVVATTIYWNAFIEWSEVQLTGA